MIVNWKDWHDIVLLDGICHQAWLASVRLEEESLLKTL
jgi:hypothetical protein